MVSYLIDEIKIVKQVQTYPLWSFGAELGGYIGMFLGVSLLQVTLQLKNINITVNRIKPKIWYWAHRLKRKRSSKMILNW